MFCLVWIFPENRKLQFSRRGKENLALLAAHMWVSTYFTILILKLFPKDFPALWWLTQGFNTWIYCASYLESFEWYIWFLKQVMSFRSPNHFAKSFWKIIVSKLFCFSIATWDKFCNNITIYLIISEREVFVELFHVTKLIINECWNTLDD